MTRSQRQIRALVTLAMCRRASPSQQVGIAFLAAAAALAFANTAVGVAVHQLLRLLWRLLWRLIKPSSPLPTKATRT